MLSFLKCSCVFSVLSYIYRSRCWRPRPSRLAPAAALLASWTGSPGSDGTVGRTPPLWCSRASTAGAPSAGWSGRTGGNNIFKSPSPASRHFLIKTRRRWSSYVLGGDVLHQQLLQFLLFKPPARAERADGHKESIINTLKSWRRSICFFGVLLLTSAWRPWSAAPWLSDDLGASLAPGFCLTLPVTQQKHSGEHFLTYKWLRARIMRKLPCFCRLKRSRVF